VCTFELSNNNNNDNDNNDKYFISRGHSFDNTSIFHEGLKHYKTINKQLTNACTCIHISWINYWQFYKCIVEQQQLIKGIYTHYIYIHTRIVSRALWYALYSLILGRFYDNSKDYLKRYYSYEFLHEHFVYWLFAIFKV